MKKAPFIKWNYYVIHHRFQSTSTKTRNLPIEQSIYSPECTHCESDVFRPKYDKSKNSTIFYIVPYRTTYLYL